jgi:7-cyano-7-deazaguanine synthase in queuosine biosynthesis
MDIKDSVVVQTAIEVIAALKRGTNFHTQLQPELLQSVLSTSIDCPEKPEGFDIKVKPWNSQQLLDEICLTSGGADSTIAWFLADKPRGLYIDINQDYASKEIEALNKLRPCGLKYRYIDLGNLDSETPLYKNWKHIIPGRNFLFLTIAAECVKDNGVVIFSVVDGEGLESDKGDKSKKFIGQWQDWYEAVTGKEVYVDTLSTHTKAGWLKEFAKTNDINIIRYSTVTCFSKEHSQCGKCQACLRKYLSFISAFGMNTSEDYAIHPKIGCKEYIDKYNVNLSKALNEKDFSHYSEKRCIEDLEALRMIK